MKKIKRVVIAAMAILSVGLFVGCGTKNVSNISTGDDAEVEDSIVYSQDFKLRNGSGIDLVDIRISPAGEENWCNNIVESEKLKTGYTINIGFKSPETSEFWDIKAIDKNGEEIKWNKVDLSKSDRITLQYDAKTTSVLYK